MCIIEHKDIDFNLIYFGDKKNISATDSFINEKMSEKVIMPASDEKDKDMGRGQGLKAISILTLFFLIIPLALVAITNIGTKINPFEFPTEDSQQTGKRLSRTTNKSSERRKRIRSRVTRYL